MKFHPFHFSTLIASLLFMSGQKVLSQDLLLGNNSSGQTSSFAFGTNSYGNIILGYTAKDSNNSLAVANANTLLANSGDFLVGYKGSRNSMVISNGGTVSAGGSLSVIGYSPGSSSNTALVTGIDALWTNIGVFADGIGNDNSLVISNGGTVAIGGAATFVSGLANSINDTALVTGVGSLWTNAGIFVDGVGSSNSLVVSNGATLVVAGTNTWIGDKNASMKNTALVTGIGSLWTNAGEFEVGNGNHNSLVISNGGTVAVGGELTRIGNLTISSNNQALVTGAGSIWTNAGEFTDGIGNHNSLVISNGGTVAVEGDSTWIGGWAGGSRNTAVVTGEGSFWTNAGVFQVGIGSHNSLVISDGGTVAVAGTNTWIGGLTTASNNSVLVTGIGSLWSNNGLLNIGFSGSGTLTLANGGMATASNGINIASQSGSKGTLNIGAFGGSDIGGTIISPTIALGSGSGGINFNQSASLIIAANISGSNARSTLNQLGSGTTTLTGSNNYDGSTTIKAGMLAAGSLGNGSLSLQGSAKSQASFSDTLGAGTLSIGILSCRGYSTIDLPSGDTLDSIGTITFKGINNLIDLSGAWTTAGDYTLLSGTKITGTGLKALELTGSFMGGLELSLDRSTNYDGLEYTFTNSGTVIELDVNPTTPALSRHFDSLATTSSATAGSLSVVAVPEPSTYLLLVLGMLTVVAVNRKIWL